MKKKRNSSPGMFTVEMAIIFPIILFTLIGLMYIGIMQYQTIITQTAAMRAASRTAYAWNGLGDPNGAWGFQLTDEDKAAEGAPAEGQLVRFNYTDHDPYASVIDGKKSNREKNGKSYFLWLLGKNPSLLGDNETTSEGEVKKSFGFLQSYVNVSVEKHYVNPMGNLAESIGLSEKVDRVITATAPVNDAPEFLRLVSLARELIRD